MMPLPHKAVALFAFTTALAGSLVAFPLVLDNPAFALDSTGSTAGHEHHMMMPSDMVEARIAYAKTALKITDAQTQQWNAVADVLRKQAKARDAEIMAMRAKYDMHRDATAPRTVIPAQPIRAARAIRAARPTRGITAAAGTMTGSMAPSMPSIISRCAKR